MVLQLKHVRKFYRYGKNKQLIVNDLSIKFPRIGMIAIVGKSGSGKSTILNLIAGIERPDNGNVIIDGHELNYQKINDYQRSYISYVYQFYNLIDSITVRENLLLLAKIKSKKISMIKIQALTDKLKITKLLECFPSELSGGEKQRVALARAFLCDTPILLADEPSGALNEVMAKEVMELLRSYAKRHLVIVISHDYNLITRYTKKVIDLDSNQNSYDFSFQNNYHKYFFHYLNNNAIKISFYLKRQLIYQRNKIIMMFFSQVFTICAFVLLISGVNGGWDYLQHHFESDPLKEIVEVSKKDYHEADFNEEQVKELRQDKLFSQLSYKLDFNFGTFKTDKEIQLNSYQIFKSNYFDYKKGKYPAKVNQVVINKETAKQFNLDINDKINFIFEEQIYSLYISAIIDDYVNSGTNIYIDNNFIEHKLHDQLVVKNILIGKSVHYKDLIKKYDQKYFLISLHQEYLDSYRILFEMAMVVIVCFLVISFIISVILISIILKTILIERKRDICLMLSNGLSLSKARRLFSQETGVIGFLIGVFGSLLSEIILQIIRLTHMDLKLFGIAQLFVLPKIIISQYDLYFFMIVVYMGTCFFVGCMTSLKISKMDMSILLKED